MNRKEAIQIISSTIGKEIIVSANGFISRDLFEINDNENNFYMIGSMGLASSIGLGIALKKPKKRVYVFDGDGNILMNLGSLVTVGFLKPGNLIHFILDNNSHESTGGQPTVSNVIQIEKIAKVSGYKIYKVKEKSELKKILTEIEKVSGPILIHIRIGKSHASSKRVTHNPIYIKNRFMRSIN